jgi:hypothetical protein
LRENLIAAGLNVSVRSKAHIVIDGSAAVFNQIQETFPPIPNVLDPESVVESQIELEHWLQGVVRSVSPVEVDCLEEFLIPEAFGSLDVASVSSGDDTLFVPSTYI